ncbi:hypothetical protein [Stenotrophomonas phage StenR_269]|nr:hypothetical protein [Stenotrophomonas phage StenR_269]
MYEKLEEAMESIAFIRNHSLFPAVLKDILDMCEQDIKEYIEEGYKIPNNEDILRETY